MKQFLGILYQIIGNIIPTPIINLTSLKLKIFKIKGDVKSLFDAVLLRKCWHFICFSLVNNGQISEIVTYFLRK